MGRKFNRDIIDAGIEDLVKSNQHPEYSDDSVKCHTAAEELTKTLKSIPDNMGRKTATIVQSLFASNYLTAFESDFFVGQLIEGIYAVKLQSSIDHYFLELHKTLTTGGYTDSPFDTGHMLFTAYQFQVKPGKYDDPVSLLLKEHGPVTYRTDIFRKVIVAEINGASAFAYVLDYSIYTGNPTSFTIYQLAKDYGDENKKQELLGIEFDMDDASYDWKTFDEAQSFGLVAELDIKSLTSKGICVPSRVESAISDLNHGTCFLKDIAGTE